MKRVETTELIADLELANADELIDQLNPDERPEFDPNGNEWVYRGQNIDAPLLPKSKRMEVLELWFPEVNGKLLTNAVQLYLEFMLLSDFLDQADFLGLPIPGDSPSLRQAIKQNKRYGALNPQQMFADETLFHLAAVAQHAGVPTRLLDFTRDPLVAAYFSCAMAEKAEGLFIWAISTKALELVSRCSQHPRLRVVVTPGAGNRNLQAQHGLFIEWWHDAVERDDKLPFQPLDLLALMRQVHDQYDIANFHGRTAPYPWIVRMSVPLSERGRVLRKLAFRKVDAARIFPSYEGIGHFLLERNGYDPAVRRSEIEVALRRVTPRAKPRQS